MITPDVFRDQPTICGTVVRLEPMGTQHFDALWQGSNDPEVRRLTGTHRVFAEDEIRAWTASRCDQHDRADWAIVRASDGHVVGEVVLNDLDPDNESVGFRIALVDAGAFGHGYGTEATRLAVDYAFDVVGVHRIELEVYAFNTRAAHVYEKCGFRRDGVLRDALRWNGEWHDAMLMSMLSTDRRPTDERSNVT